MLVLRWLLMILGVCVFGSVGALVAYDIYLSSQLRRLLRQRATRESGVQWKATKHVRLYLQRAA